MDLSKVVGQGTYCNEFPRACTSLAYENKSTYFIHNSYAYSVHDEALVKVIIDISSYKYMNMIINAVIMTNIAGDALTVWERMMHLMSSELATGQESFSI